MQAMNSAAKAKYEAAQAERQKHVEAILGSPERKKIVVAGPGTGKTHLFKRILAGKGKTLTLTFVNSLVEDLSLELCGISDVQTLHAYARSTLAAAKKKNKVFAKLSAIIREDANILLKKDIDFDYIFHNKLDHDERIQFYRKRKGYYDHYGFADIVYAAVKYFEEDKGRIPSYSQVVVDEFQDFNKLEVCLIELLAEKSPILLAGDDDQALYGDLKSASAEHIRNRHANGDSGYKGFTLPYCSRCTRPIVDAANDVIVGAVRNGNLKGRLPKPYIYFDDENKDRESERNPTIVHGHFFAAQMAYAITRLLGVIAKAERQNFSVLLISPTRLQSRALIKALRAKGLGGIEPVEARGGNEPTLLDGLKILLEDRKCNLGWRIVAKAVLDATAFETLLKESDSLAQKGLRELVSKDKRADVEAILSILRAVRDGNEVAPEDLDHTLMRVGISGRDLAVNALLAEMALSGRREGDPSVRKIPIKATTVQSSKGLAADYVFITHFDDQYFIKDKDKSIISDQDVCNFLVALTRARKRVFLLSSDAKKKPAFLRWIRDALIDGPGF